MSHPSANGSRDWVGLVIPTKPHQRVTAAVFSGAESRQAGLQIRVGGKIRSGHVLALANKKKPLRVCVGTPDSRSSVWNAWANRTSSDVYVAIRSSAGLHKISLHESGDFRYQLIGTTKATLNRPDLSVATPDIDTGGRILHRWPRPSANNTGWTDCLSIVAPASELQSGWGNLGDPYGIQWIPIPDQGYAVEIKGFLVTPGGGELDLTSAMNPHGALSALGGFKLANGEVFVLLSATVPVSADEQEATSASRARGRSMAHPDFDWSAENVPRMLMWGANKNGYPTFVDARA